MKFSIKDFFSKCDQIPRESPPPAMFHLGLKIRDPLAGPRSRDIYVGPGIWDPSLGTFHLVPGTRDSICGTLYGTETQYLYVERRTHS